MLSLEAEEERIWRAYRLGQNHGYEKALGLDALLEAVRSDEAFKDAMETREQKLERLLADERAALSALRSLQGE